MDARSAFSYACTRCGRCCAGKRIQVNPYEIAHLAQGLGQGTAAVRDAYTVDGAALRQTEDGACIFFDPAAGCTVHADRPLVCRLFPLGRYIDEAGEVTWWRGAFDPPPAGAFGEDGTVAGFVAAQGAEPYIHFADAYFRWYLKASNDGAHLSSEAPRASDLLDIDAVLAGHCARTGEAEPVTPEDRAALHLEILDRLVVVGG